MIDLDTARAIVQQLYENAEDPLLEVELEKSKGRDNYRPWFVAARFMLAEYRQLTRADDVSFSYRIETIQNLFSTQSSYDIGDVIPPGFEANTQLELDKSYIGITII